MVDRLKKLLRTAWDAAWLSVLLQAALLPDRGSWAVDAVVVRPEAWASALTDWKDHREAQGYEIAEIDSGIGRQAIRSAVVELAQANPDRLRFVLLAGDVSAQEATSVPTFYHNSTAMVQFGGDPIIASDNPYGDVDGDQQPELAVGRIPADSASQLAGALARTIAFENEPDYSQWRRDVHIVAGVGGFGAVADAVIEMTTRRFLADRIPAWSELSMTQASIQSHYCPDPLRFSEACLDRLNQGGMFWVYIGHGHVKTLDYLRVENRLLPILNSDHVPAVNVGSRAPIAIFLACYTGAFDAREDSLAEELVMSKSGPIAALAASRVSGPYGLAMLSDGLLENCFRRQTPTLGQVVMAAKQKLFEEASDTPQTGAESSQLQMIDAIAGALSPEGYDLQAERLEHVQQMNLLGDPMLHLSYPQELPLEAPDEAEPGTTITVGGTSSLAGKLTIELTFRREQVRRQLDAIPVDASTEAGREQYQLRYAGANRRVIVAEEVDCGVGAFRLDLAVPADLPRGKYRIRGYLEGPTGWQAGHKTIRVRTR